MIGKEKNLPFMKQFEAFDYQSFNWYVKPSQCLSWVSWIRSHISNDMVIWLAMFGLGIDKFQNDFINVKWPIPRFEALILS